MQNPCAPNRSRHLIVFVLVCALSANATGTNDDLLAYFKLDSSAKDSAGKCADFELAQAPFVDGSLYCNGCYENSGTQHGYKANARVPPLSYDAFTVSLDFHPIDFRPEQNLGIIDQILWFVTRGHLPSSVERNWSGHETIIVAGEAYRWFGFRCVSNHLELTLNNHAYVHAFSNAPVELNHWHNVISSFDIKKRQVIVTFDGRVLETVNLPNDFQVKHTDKTGDRLDKAFCLQDYSNGSVFYGFVNNLKVFAHPFSETEVLALYANDASERTKLRAFSHDSGWAGYAIVAVVSAIGGVILWLIYRRKGQTERRMS